MPTKAQNEVYQKYGLRKATVRRSLSCVRDDLSYGVSRAQGNILTTFDLAPLHMAVASLARLSKIWRAYQECDRDN